MGPIPIRRVNPMNVLDRRAVLTGASAAGALALAGCVSTNPSPSVQASVPPNQSADAAPPPDQSADAALPPETSQTLEPGVAPDYSAIYGPVTSEPFPVPAIKLSQINRAFLRKTVDYQTSEQPGTIVIDPAHHYLYHVQEGGKAMRYGVGVGREGFAWSGVAMIHDKQEWPDWYPPK